MDRWPIQHHAWIVIQCLAYVREHAIPKKLCLFLFFVTGSHGFKFEFSGRLADTGVFQEARPDSACLPSPEIVATR